MFSTFQLSKLDNSQASASEIRTALIIILLLLIIDIVIIVYAIYCLSDCAKKNKIPTWLAIVLGLLIFSPGFGSLLALCIIVFHVVSCGKATTVATRYDFF